MKQSYADFLKGKSQFDGASGFAPVFMPSKLIDFQAFMTDHAIRTGRSAMFQDCGMGKSFQELVWAENVHRHTNKPVLILTPLAVSYQTVLEGEKFGIEARRVVDGKIHKCVNVTNYERLHLLNPTDFSGVVCDESSILKSYDGSRRGEITDFMRKMEYRLLGTATAAPNDYTELGTSSEALGYLGHMDMLNRFFKNDQNNSKVGRHYGEVVKWRFKGHAEQAFWRWVCSWARALRKPSDFGFVDGKFVLPPLEEVEHCVKTTARADGFLFDVPAVGLSEQREERRRSITERCEKAAALATHKDQAMVWCHLNPEGDLLEKSIKGAEQISGKDADEAKEEKFLAFAKRQIRVLVTKPKIGAWGLNFQNCAHVISFPSHSFEQHYQAIRRCWRFGQTRTVRSDIVTTEGERDVLLNLRRKSAAADNMFSSLLAEMNKALKIERVTNHYEKKEEMPAWL